jgi:hypothetical protein
MLEPAVQVGLDLEAAGDDLGSKLGVVKIL